MSRLRIPVALTLVVTSIASAQVATDTARIEAVVVTATRNPLAVGDLPASVSIIQGADLRARGIVSVADALRDVPGVAVARAGSFGAQTSVFVRGGQSNYTKVLVDGVPMNQPGGAFDWSTLSADNVERIEVVRGPSSVVWGSDAVTGVVNVITRSGRGGSRLMGSVRHGTFGTLDMEGQVSQSSTAATYSLGIGTHRTDGIYDFNNQNGSTTLSGRAEAAINEKTDAGFSVRYADNVSHYPTDGSGQPVDSNAFTTASQLAFNGHVRRIVNSKLTLQGLLTASSHDGGSDDAAGQGSTDSFESLDHITRRSAEVRAISSLRSGTVFSIGGQLEEEAQRSHSQSAFGTFTSANVFNAVRHNSAGFLELVNTSSKTTATLGGRVDDNEQFGTFGTFRVSGQVEVAPELRLRANAGTAFREPSFFESFSTAFTTGNPNLKPEQTSSWEAGVTYGDFVHVSATYFHQQFTNLIDYDGAAAPGSPNYQNIAKAQSNGVEIELSHPPIHGIRFDVSLTQLATKVIDRGFSTANTATLVKDSSLLRRPGMSGSFRVGYVGIARLRTDLAITYTGERDDRRFNPDFTTDAVKLPAYTLLDLSAEYSLPTPPGRPGISLMLRGENLTDEKYESVVGYKAPGLRLLGGVRVSY